MGFANANSTGCGVELKKMPFALWANPFRVVDSQRNTQLGFDPMFLQQRGSHVQGLFHWLIFKVNRRVAHRYRQIRNRDSALHLRKLFRAARKAGTPSHSWQQQNQYRAWAQSRAASARQKSASVGNSAMPVVVTYGVSATRSPNAA